MSTRDGRITLTAIERRVRDAYQEQPDEAPALASRLGLPRSTVYGALLLLRGLKLISWKQQDFSRMMNRMSTRDGRITLTAIERRVRDAYQKQPDEAPALARRLGLHRSTVSGALSQLRGRKLIPQRERAIDRVAAAYQERPDTPTQIARRIGLTTSCVWRCLMVLHQIGRIQKAARPERLPTSAYTTAQWAAYRSLLPAERAVLAAWDRYDTEPTIRQLGSDLKFCRERTRRALETLRACGLLPESIWSADDSDDEPDEATRTEIEHRLEAVQQARRPTPVVSQKVFR